MHGALADLAEHLGDVVGRDAARSQAQSAIDVGLDHGAAGVGLEGQRLREPALTEAVDERGVVALACVGEAVEQTVHALEDGARTREAGAGEERGAQTRLRGPACVQALGGAAVGQVFDDAARHRAGDAEGVGEPAGVEPQGGADAGRRGDRAEHGGGMEAGLVHGLGGDQAQAADGLDADRDAEQHLLAVETLLLGDGEHGRHDDGTGVHGSALEGVVEVLAVGRGAVDEGRTRGAEVLQVADGGRGAGIGPGGERGLHVVGAAGDHAQADDVDEQALAGVADCRRQSRRVEGGDAPG